MEDDPRWKIPFDGRRPFMEEDLKSNKTNKTPCAIKQKTYDCTKLENKFLSCFLFVDQHISLLVKDKTRKFLQDFWEIPFLQLFVIFSVAAYLSVLHYLLGLVGE